MNQAKGDTEKRWCPRCCKKQDLRVAKSPTGVVGFCVSCDLQLMAINQSGPVRSRKDF